MTMNKLVSHHFLTASGNASPDGQLYSYLVAGNGVFVTASGPAVTVCFPIAECEIRGLPSLKPAFYLARPKVPANYVTKMLELSIANYDDGRKREALFHLIWLEEEFRWRLDMPEQEAGGTSVKPLDDGPESSYAQALIEVHSHHEMEARFSTIDDADEQGFRVYGVLGEIFTEPKLCVRVGVYGQFWEVPASEVFELPSMMEGFVPEGWMALEAAA